MQFTWSHSLRLSLCAAAVCALGAVNAQTTPPAASAEPAAAAQAQSHEGKKPHHMQRHHRSHKDGQRGQRGKYATPQEHEAAAARAEERAGRMPRGESMDQYQRNALARCDVFREPEDRNSCAERVRSGDVSGSVQGGGVLREFTEQVPVKP